MDVSLSLSQFQSTKMSDLLSLDLVYERNIPRPVTADPWQGAVAVHPGIVGSALGDGSSRCCILRRSAPAVHGTAWSLCRNQLAHALAVVHGRLGLQVVGLFDVLLFIFQLGMRRSDNFIKVEMKPCYFANLIK